MRVMGILLALGCACPLVGQAGESPVANELWDFHARLQAAMGERGAEAIPDFYAADAVIMPAESGRLDRSQFVEMIRASADLPDAYYRAEPEKYIVASSGDMAYEIGRYELGFGTPDGPVRIQGDYVAVLMKRNGRWWVTLQVDSPNPA